MPDIASALIKLAEAIIERSRLKKTSIIDPYIIVVPTSAQPITKNYAPAGLKVFYVGIEVRNMGTATYIAVGRRGTTESRLVVQNAYQEFEAPRGSYLDASEIFIVSDTADAVVEITGVLAQDE